MLYKKRNIFLSELSGKHKLGKNTDLHWFGSITTTSMSQPDNKRLTWIRNDQEDNDRYGQYAMNFMFTANPAMSGRLFQNLTENEYSAGAKLIEKIKIKDYDGNIHLGIFASKLQRSFEARNFGYRIANVMQFDWDMAYLPTEQIFTEDYINNSNGIILDEITNPSDSYTAYETNYSIYTAWQQKLHRFSWYLGIRAEYNTMSLNSYTTDATNPPMDDDKVNYKNPMLFFSPSLAIGYDINEKMKIKFNFGKTYDKPQFREIAPYAFYDYEAKAVIIGNPDLQNATINHFNLRYEYYFSLDELLSFDIFYKTFQNAIEYKIIPAGTGLQYSYQNVPNATAIGVETEIHKKILPWMFAIANVSLIKSNVMFKNESIENDRMLQGQSPYVVNGGLFFQFDSIDLQAAILYNVFGKRIAFVGDPYTNNPDIYELPYHNLKFNISKTFAHKFTIDFQINNILGGNKEFMQIEKSNAGNDVKLTTEKSVIPRIYSFKITVKI
jgi:outer membrane cobalamin receptor